MTGRAEQGRVSRSGLFRIIIRLKDTDKFRNKMYLVGCTTCKRTHVMNILTFEARKHCPLKDGKPEFSVGDRFGDIEITGKAAKQMEGGFTVSTICRRCNITRKDYVLWRLRYEDGARQCQRCPKRY